MRSARAQDLPPFHVTARLDESGSCDVFVTDGRSVGRHARSRPELPALRRLSQVAADGDLHASLTLFAQLFPGVVGATLRGSEPRRINLQLDAALHGLHWELASDGHGLLGERWRVARHLLVDDDRLAAGGADLDTDIDLAATVRRVPRRGPLRVLRLGDAAGPAGAAAPALPALDSPTVVSTTLARDAVAADAVPGLLAEHDVICLAAGVPHELLAGVSWLRPPKLFVVGPAPASQVARLAQRLAVLGASLLVAPSVAVEHGDDGPGWFATLCERLAQAQPIAEAVRAARGLHDERGAAWLQLYGDGDAVLVLPDARASAGNDARQVTSLSFDFVDSTGWLHRLGSERYASLLAEFHQRSIAQIERHGGVADDPQGDDGVMSYFGFPSASERSAEQAVAAGLAIVQSVAGMSTPVQVRVGIATGRVSVMAGQPVGVSIHLAARLQSRAAPGTVMVSDMTLALVQHRFTVQPLESTLALKGIEGAQRAGVVLHDRKEHRLDALPRLTPFVGRDAELAVLLHHWDALQAGALRVVQLRGDAGIGKSRLVREFRHGLKARGALSFECRCLPDHASSAFHAVIDAMHHWMGVRDDDDEATRRRKLADAMPPGMDPAQALPVVAALLSLPGEPLAGTPERLRERTLATLVEWFQRSARARPLCLVVEDLHWVDPSTREFLGRLLAGSADVPMLVLLTERTGPDEAAAPWQPPVVHETLELHGLRPDESRRLLKQACGESLLPAGVVRLLAGRSDGVPLFLEESARMMVEQSATLDEMLPQSLDVPGSLQDLLMARLDRLGPARAIAQFGAVLGREFPVALLQQVLAHGGRPMTPQELTAQLDAIEQSGLLASVGGTDGSGERRCAFKHALVRDIAYQSLWTRDRQLVHRAVAAVLRDSWPELAQRQPELLAHHQTEAGLAAEALGQWEVAARLAASRSAHDEAIQHLQRALALLDSQPPAHERRAIELRLQLLLASRYIATEGYGAPPVERAYARAEQLGDELGDPGARLKAQLGLEGYHFMRADFPRAHEIARRAEALAEQSGDTMARLQVRWATANILFHEGHGLAAVQRMDECLAVYRPEHHRRAAVQDPGVMCLCYSAWGQWELGHPDDALARIERVQQLARTLDHKFSLGEAFGFAANVHRYRGEQAQALACAEQAIAICDEGGFAVWLAHAHVMRGWLQCERGLHDEGVAEMREGLALWARSGAVVTRPLYLTLLAEGLARGGDLAQALARLDEAMGIVQAHGERYYEAEVRRLIAELTLRRDGPLLPAARRAAEQGLQAAHALAMQQHKRGFALRSATSLARLWHEDGRTREALQLLKPAFASFTEGLQTHDLRQARELLRSMG
ncbi:AAA family ATPase [Rhizobacter sp. SG703]|uniref:ATP-binding protein n=1 Tax=Rhizobacter sp. SG703 TaxID=2587140 RepID=UPI0014470D5F|nr:AAA family ATPase [Rhizobacter sp. SG703]NKI93691.1 class 3 adenylate cyclase/predicted ATPase [Rhizobacter sp. SG703]